MSPLWMKDNPPKLSIWQVHSWVKSLPDTSTEPVTTKMTSEQFEITMSDAWHRLEKLREFMMLRYYDKKKSAKGGFVLTKYGRRFERDPE